MKIKVLSRQAMEEFTTDKNHLIISITDPNSEKVKIISKPIHMISLQFHDIDNPLVPRNECDRCKGTGYLKQFKGINDGHCYKCTTMLDIKLFSEKQAEFILYYVDYYKKAVDLIAVHCEAGISRSAGVAGALSLIYNGSDKFYFDNYLPNIFVYRKILNAYMKKENKND